MQLDLHRVTFFHDRFAEAVFSELTLRLHPGWTAVVGANGAGKTTLLRLITGELDAAAGSIRAPGETVYCPQRTDDPPAGLTDFLLATDRAACTLAGQLGIEEDWAKRWTTLSHGERKRAQIGVALWAAPMVLALDEPTNHVDAEARGMLLAALRSFRGIGLLVSHDRDLMDALCRRCLVVSPGGVEERTGSYSEAAEQERADEERDRRRLAEGRKELKRLEREARARAELTDAANRKKSKRGLAAKDHDAKSRIDQARVTGKDGRTAKRRAAMESRVSRTRSDLQAIDAKREQRTGITMPGERAKRSFLLRVPAGELPLGGGRRLRYPTLEIGPADRIALTGRNGAGKTTLLTHLLALLDLPEGRVLHLPQEIEQAEAQAVAEAVRRLPGRERGRVLTIVSRLGSDPVRVLETALPSPGEARKLLLARGLAKHPWLVVMDEPTNHLDLPSVVCLEDALADCPAALLLVSHDETFLERLTDRRWEIDDQDRLIGGSPPTR